MGTIDSDTEDLDVVPDDAALRLLEDYEAGSSFYFSSPRGAVLARGVEAVVPKVRCGKAGLPQKVAEFLAGARGFNRPDPMVVGAVPFGENLPAHLVLPSEVVRAEPLRTTGESVRSVNAPECAVQPVPLPEEYERGVQRVLRRIADGEMSKIVLARSLQLTAQQPIEIQDVLRNLATTDPSGYTFAVDLPRRGEDGIRDPRGPHPEFARTFLGASPELLVSRFGGRVRANPMAGSRPRSTDPVEDQRRAAELSTSDKDLREHAAVVDAVVEQLRPFCSELDVQPRPSVISTAAMWHLATEITGRLKSTDTTSLELAAALHPTPAVCGTPVDQARKVIAEIEPFDRGYYAGMVGWCDASGDGEWVVAIRCAEIEDEVLRLFAGAGIVEGSDPASELAETTAKFRTALSAMGLE
ncbi:MAG: isochorismate synthase DhbC [Saccharopolyspora rectivirgula]|jgi:isochorismate synthase|uniref:isochorismate synthase DhbC n=1 Tax=Saccharopolyspora rectivirgula TaxID=28042 RepID=UPI00056976E7|nr:isochorismate synthase DhbC [Saccharopolyspora rectivirgula]